MVHYAEVFVEHLDFEEVKYTAVDDMTVNLIYSADNMETISVFVIFDKDGDPVVSLKCWSILNFKEKREAAYEACNELNAKYRWIRFYIDGDGDVVADVDAYVDEESCGEICYSLVNRMVSVVDEAYPVLARARWN